MAHFCTVCCFMAVAGYSFQLLMRTPRGMKGNEMIMLPHLYHALVVAEQRTSLRPSCYPHRVLTTQGAEVNGQTLSVMILTAQRASHLTIPIVRTLVIQLHTDCWATFSLFKPWPLLCFLTPFYSSYSRKCAKAERERQRASPCVSPLFEKERIVLRSFYWTCIEPPLP